MGRRLDKVGTTQKDMDKEEPVSGEVRVPKPNLLLGMSPNDMEAQQDPLCIWVELSKNQS